MSAVISTYVCVGGDCDGSRIAPDVWRLIESRGGVIGRHDRYVEQTVTAGRGRVTVLIPEAGLRDDALVERLVAHYWPHPRSQQEVPT